MPSLKLEKSRREFERAKSLFPGGVNSPVRAFRGVGGDPVFIARGEKARLLGFQDFADFVLHDRMAHSGARAMAFLEDLKVKTDPFYEKENVALEKFAGRRPEPSLALVSFSVGA